MRGSRHGTNGPCSGPESVYVLILACWLTSSPRVLLKAASLIKSIFQIGFSIMASVPGSDKVYPLLGRPQDSLSLDTNAEFVLPSEDELRQS